MSRVVSTRSLAALFAASLALAACGGGSDGDETAADETTTILTTSTSTSTTSTTLATTTTTEATTTTSSSTTSSTTSTTAAAAEPVIALDVDGLRVVDPSGSTTPLSFGSSSDTAIGAVNAVFGNPVRNVTTDCPSGPVQQLTYGNGFVLNLASDQLVGWFVSSGTDAASTLTTMSGVGIGSTLAEIQLSLDVEVVDETLGPEFRAVDLYGILTSTGPDGVVESIWGGDGCVFR